MDSIWLIAINIAAGLYAAVLWGFFAVVRFRRGLRVLGTLAGIMAIVSALVGVGYLAFAFDPATPPVWLRWFVSAALVLPASLHLASWMQARRFIAAADPGDDE